MVEHLNVLKAWIGRCCWAFSRGFPILFKKAESLGRNLAVRGTSALEQALVWDTYIYI